MTMHLELGLTTLRTGKPRKKKNTKMTQAKLEKYEQQMRQYNKDMRKWGLSHQQLDLKKYIDYPLYFKMVSDNKSCFSENILSIYVLSKWLTTRNIK